MSDGTEVCAHCALPLGPRPVCDGEHSFCCSGCRAVHASLLELGLGDYYSRREGSGVRVPETVREFDYLDDESFTRTHTTPLGSGVLRTELHLAGLHCSACVYLVEKLPQLSSGVLEARLNYSEARLEVVFRPSVVKLSRIARTLARLGYAPYPSGGEGAREQRRRAERRLLVRMGVAGAAFGNVMLLGLALYSGEAHGMQPGEVEFFRWLSMLVGVPAVLFAGETFFRGAVAAVRTRTAHMDLPITVGIVAALASSTLNTLRAQGEVYFDSVTMLVFLLLVGRFVQARQLGRAREATDLMLSLAPSTCRVITPGGVVERPSGSVEVGARVEIRSGDRVAVDGVVLEGASSIDRSLLNGESRPVPVAEGDEVHAGTVNLRGRLVVRVTVTGQDTRLSGIVKEVERAARAKAPFVEFADRVSFYFLGGVLVLAAVALWLGARHGAKEAVERAVAVLIVTCPCALGLATPLAGSLALGQAARRGILIKGARYLELLSRPAWFVFDKTGTLTRGRLAVVDFDGDTALQRRVACAEAGSAHPVAVALREAFSGSAGVDQAVWAEESLGRGVRARVDGHELWIGSRQFVVAGLPGGALPETAVVREAALLGRGVSPVFAVEDGRVAAVFGLGDPLRGEARASLLALRAAGHRLAISSGDRADVVADIAARLGVEFDGVYAERSPEQKLELIEQLSQDGPVFMVGDGVNDAAALTRADVGIAVFGGAEASLAAADVFSTRGGLTPVVELSRASRRAMALVRGNLGFSLTYNAVAAVLALAGYVHPLVAAVIMPLSSLTVVLNTIRYRCFEPVSAGDEAVSAPSPVPLTEGA